MEDTKRALRNPGLIFSHEPMSLQSARDFFLRRHLDMPIIELTGHPVGGVCPFATRFRILMPAQEGVRADG
jgi:hypothetical protein